MSATRRSLVLQSEQFCVCVCVCVCIYLFNALEMELWIQMKVPFASPHSRA
jgi:hypothetical protein